MTDSLPPVPAGLRLNVVVGVGRGQAQRLRLAYQGDERIRVLATCASAPEVIEWCQRGAVDGAIVDEDLHQLDREHLAEIRARGLRLVVLSRSPDASTWEGLAGPTLPIDADPGEIVMSLRRALRGDIGQRHRRGARISSPATPSVPAPVRARSLRPRTIAFWGGAGSPGRTTLALSTLALSGAVRPTVLLELDTTGASLAAYLDDGDDWRPRRARCSVLELVNAGPRTPEDWDRELARVSQPLGTFSTKAELIVGVPHPAQGSALSGSFAASLIAELERRFETVLLDLGDEPVSGSGVEAAVSATALQAADWVLVVTTPEPASLHRARLAIVEAGDALDRSRAAVVINRLDRRHPVSIDRVEVGLGLPVIACLPLDYQAAQRAQADAQPVVCDTGSKLRKPLAQLLERLNGDPLASAELVGRSGPGVSTLRRLRAAAAPLLAFGGSR